MDTDAEAADLFHSRRRVDPRDVENLQSAKATLEDHLGTVEDRHHAVAAELVHVTATLVNEVNLFGKRFTDQSK